MFKKLILLTVLLLNCLITFSQQLPPKSNTLVTDYTNTLSAEDKQRLEQKLVAFNDSTTTQIAIVIIKSVGQYDINQYGTALGRKWGIGQKGKNNGILVLVALGDRKVSIQTGYGAEGAIPDVIANDIIKKDITPRFKQNDYYGGLNAGTDNIIKYIKGEYKSEKQPQQGSKAGGTGFIILLIAIIIFVLLFIFGSHRGGRVIGGRGGVSPFWWFLGGTMLGSGKGGLGGGDSGSSGFGGFGGGGFGGGGSSGSW